MVLDSDEIRRLLSSPRSFEWDDRKRQSNVAKHGIDFGDTIDAFADPRHWVYRSTRPASEPRYVCIGQAKGVLIAVVFTPRDDRIRIMSARAARPFERDNYG